MGADVTKVGIGGTSQPDTQPPTPPANLQTQVISSSQINLSWTAPTTNVDGTVLTDLAGYRLYYGTSSGSYPLSVEVSKVTAYTVSGLTNNLTYYFAVTAYDTSANESGFSNEVSKLIALIGDLDGDSKVGLGDLRVLVKMLVGQIPPKLPDADLTGDGILSLSDLRTLVKLIVGG